MKRSLLLALTIAALGCPSVAFGQTSGRFTLGLRGDYLDQRQQIGSDVSTQRSPGATFSLGLDGQLLGPGFLIVNGLVQYTLYDFNGTGEQSSVRNRLWTYGAGLRLFETRLFSLRGNFFRNTSDVTGASVGTVVSGTQENREGEVGLNLPGNLPRIRLTVGQDQFTPDDPATLRGQRTRRGILRLTEQAGIVDLGVDLRREELEAYEQLVRQQAWYGSVDLSLNRAGADSFQSTTTGNRLRSANQGADWGPNTDVLTTVNTFRHSFTSRSWVTVGYSLQTSQTLDQRQRADFGSLGFVTPLSSVTQLETTLGYLTSDSVATIGSLKQPTASVGVKWNRTSGSWFLFLNPVVSYVATFPDVGQNESSIGGGLAGSVQRDVAAGSILLEVSAFGNQLSIAAAGAPGSPTGQSFLAGLEKQRVGGRLTWARKIERTGRVRIWADASQRIRVYQGSDVTEQGYSGGAEARVSTVGASASASSYETTGDLPSRTKVYGARLTWDPKFWLGFDAQWQHEDRTAFESQGRLDSYEGGVRLAYAKLTCFLRYQRTRSTAVASPDRTDQRIWAGLQRTFDFPFGQTAQGYGSRNAYQR